MVLWGVQHRGTIQTRYLIYLVKEEAASKPYAYIQNVQVALLGGMVPAAFALLVYCLWVMAGQNRRLVLKGTADSLTGLLNHASMRRGISALLKKEAGIHVLMILDLDHFKQINDTYGHQAGDRVLELVAGRLRGIFRSTDLIGRIGGDEFMIFMRSIGEEEMGLERAKRLCQAVHEIKLEAWPDLKVGAASGSLWLLRTEIPMTSSITWRTWPSTKPSGPDVTGWWPIGI